MSSEQLDQVLLSLLDHKDPEGEVPSWLAGLLFYHRLQQFQHLATIQYSCKSFTDKIQCEPKRVVNSVFGKLFVCKLTATWQDNPAALALRLLYRLLNQYQQERLH